MASALSHIVYRTGWLVAKLHQVGSLYTLTKFLLNRWRCYANQMKL